MKRLLTVAVVAGSMFAVSALASAAQPTQADFDACNQAAQAGASNAQLRGMSDQGAKDPAFKTAYQECMKRRGC